MPVARMVIISILMLTCSGCQQSISDQEPPLTEPVPVDIVAVPEADSDCRIELSEPRMCTMVYQPVCGCDGKTYSNGCMAGNAGITRMTQGECATDRSGLD